MKKRNLFVLFIIVLIAFLLRVYNVSEIPPSLSWDEVSIGYNAYSILKTGHDEHGKFLPFDAFVAYGDYKPPLSIYATVPFVAIFGLTELAVRLPSVVAGTLSVLVLYFFTKELFYSSKSFVIPEVAALLLAISPWHIQLSRAGFEGNIALLFVLLGSYFLLRKWFLIGWIPYIAAMYTFNSARYVVIMLGVIFVLYLKHTVARTTRTFTWGLVLALVALVPIMPHLVSKEARQRFGEVNIFTDPGVVTTANVRMSVDGNLFGNLFHNRRIGYARSYLLHFFDNLEPRFLFTRGDGNPKFSLQDVGQMYMVELPLLVLGFIWLFANFRAIAWLLAGWIIVSILPAATARETPHALRIENALPAFLIATAYGISQLRRRPLFALVIVILYVANFSFFWHNYMNHYPYEFSGEWQYGYKQAIEKIAPLKGSYKNIVLSENIGRPYTYVSFYEKIDPLVMRNTIQGSFDAAGFYNVTALGKYQFVRSVDTFEKDTLYILSPREMPQGARILDTVRLLNGSAVFSIFDI